MASTVYAELHDSQLYVSDVELISRSGWLNDQCISFWEQHLKHTTQPASCPGGSTNASTSASASASSTSSSSAPRLIFLEPCSTFMLQYIDAEELLADTPDNQYRLLRTASLVFLPFNDSSDAEAVGGGTHWTLLVVEVAQVSTVVHPSCNPRPTLT